MTFRLWLIMCVYMMYDAMINIVVLALNSLHFEGPQTNR